MVELVDTQDLGSCAARRVGSSPTTRTMASVLTAFERLLRILAFCIPKNHALDARFSLAKKSSNSWAFCIICGKMEDGEERC